MKKETKDALKIGVITALLFLIIGLMLFLIKFGYHELLHTNTHQELLYFMPLWMLMVGYSGYGIAKKAYQAKYTILGDKPEKASAEMHDEWRKWRSYYAAYYLKIAGRIAAVMGLFYLAGLLTNMNWLPSSITFVVVLFLFAPVALIIARQLERKTEL